MRQEEAAKAPGRQGATGLPNFMIIGAMRSGTTTLSALLRAHPDVYMAPKKEVHYFSRHWERGVDWYVQQFAGRRGEVAMGEATPSYMYFDDAVERMASVVPEARLIAILRDPVDRAWSHYWRGRVWGLEELDFRRALEAEPERLQTADAGLFGYIDRGRYLRQLQNVCRFYRRDALNVVLFEDLVKAPRETLQEVCRFIGVDDSFEPPNLGVRSAPFMAVRSQRVRRLAASLRPRLLRKAVARLNQKPGVRYPEMSPEIRAETAAFFAEDNAALAAWLGRDLSNWSAPQ